MDSTVIGGSIVVYSSTGSDLGNAKASWGEISPSEHIAQFYRNNSDLMDTLSGFLHGCLNSGESAIVIATPEHLRTVCRLLPDTGVDMQRALREDRFITLDANIALSSFMVDDWPDEQLLTLFVEGLIRRTTRRGQRVRAFGEMVALLWSQGHYAATVQLERMWHRLCHSYSFPLLCSYPTAGLAKDPLNLIAEIRAAHSRVIF